MGSHRGRLIADGFAAGLVGYFLVAGFFVVLDILAGRPPLYTVALIGESVSSRSSGPPDVSLAAGPILAVNGVHLAAFLLFGFFGAWLARQAERRPEYWYLALLSFLGATVISYAGVLAAMALIGSPVSPGSVVAASVVGAAGMAVYLVVTHRAVIRTVRDGKRNPAEAREY